MSDTSPALVMRTNSSDRTLKGEPEITTDRHPEAPGTVVVQPRSPAHTNGKRRGQDSPGATSHHPPRSVWVALQMDWARRASRPDAHQHVGIWTQAAPQLEPFASPAEILDAVGRLGRPEQSCRLLSGLLIAAHHDALAAHAVLVALIPGLRVAAGRRWQTARGDGPWTSRDELDIDTISAAWQAIAAHAGERHDRPGRLIVRQVERRLRSSYEAYQRDQSRGFPMGDAELQIPDPRSAESTAALLDDAVRVGRLGRIDGALAHLVAIDGRSLSAVSRQFGLKPLEAQSALRRAAAALDLPVQAAPPEPAQRPPSPTATQPKEAYSMLPLLLTVNQAANLLGVGRTTIYELMDSGELFSVHRGASRRIPLWAAYDYVDRLCGGSFRQIPVRAVVDYLARLASEP